MLPIKRYQVRGLPGLVNRVKFAGRIVDFWSPVGGSDHLLIAHDGQNIFDRRTASFLYTWRLGPNALRVAREANATPPLIIAVFHSNSKSDPFGRSKDLCPEEPFRNGMQTLAPPKVGVDELRGDRYLGEVFEGIVPKIAAVTGSQISPAQTAMIGSSMGGLATLYAAIKHPDKFHTALALSTHWTLAGEPLVDWMIPRLPNSKTHKVWMSRGTKGLDKDYPPFQERADQLMRSLEWGARYQSKVFDRSSHNERSWASYVAQPLRFWLGVKQ